MAQQMSLRADQLRGGAGHLGWKVAFGAPASLQLMEIEGPLVGFLTESRSVDSGASVEVSGWDRCVVEFEVALFVDRDVLPGADEDTVRAAVAGLGPAIELANVNLPVRPDALSDILAGNIFHEAVVLGEPDGSRRAIEITGLEAVATVDGVELARTHALQDLTGRYPEIVATVASTLASHGEVLRAGDVIITGSVFPPIPVDADGRFEFALDPLPAISVEVEGSAGA